MFGALTAKKHCLADSSFEPAAKVFPGAMSFLYEQPEFHVVLYYAFNVFAEYFVFDFRIHVVPGNSLLKVMI